MLCHECNQPCEVGHYLLSFVGLSGNKHTTLRDSPYTTVVHGSHLNSSVLHTSDSEFKFMDLVFYAIPGTPQPPKNAVSRGFFRCTDKGALTALEEGDFWFLYGVDVKRLLPNVWSDLVKAIRKQPADNPFRRFVDEYERLEADAKSEPVTEQSSNQAPKAPSLPTLPTDLL